MKKIKILYLIDHFHGSGGTENHLARLVISLDKEKFKCIIVAFDFVENNLANKIRNNGVEILHISVGRYYTYNAFVKAAVINRLIKSESIDIVQTFHIKSDFYGTLIAKLSGIQFIISSKRDVGDLKNQFHFFLNRLVNKIPYKYIVVADAVGNVVVEREGVSFDKLLTIYNGVDINKFELPSLSVHQNAKNQFGFDVCDFVVGTVAWLRPEKNYKIFFDAIAKASRKVNNLKAVAVGGDEDGLQLDFFKKYVVQAGIADKVTFAGQVGDVRPYLRSFDVGCLVPGGNEGFSNSIIEKMSMGLPMVVSDVGGNAEAVVHGYNGFVVPPNDSERLAEALIYLAEHPEERKKMGERSAQRVRDMFTLEGMTNAHEKLYESCMAD